jgi:outer membrane protein
MKKIFTVLLFMIATAGAMHVEAQARVAYVDTEYILDQMPEYQAAQKKLDDISNQWKKQAQGMADTVQMLYKQYQAEWVLLPENTRKKREEEITNKEKALNDFKMAKFGPDGELFKKREQFIRPVQDKVFDAIQQLAKQAALDIILDKSGAVTMLYTNAKYDRSDEVLSILGIDLNKKDEK